MSHLDDLPKRNKNHSIDTKAAAAFEGRLSSSDLFYIQQQDRTDYGTDYQIEVITEQASNADGSVSVEINRSNLNYLMMNPYSFFVCYHIPTDRLLICSADSVLRDYEVAKAGQNKKHLP